MRDFGVTEVILACHCSRQHGNFIVSQLEAYMDTPTWRRTGFFDYQSPHSLNPGRVSHLPWKLTWFPRIQQLLYHRHSTKWHLHLFLFRLFCPSVCLSDSDYMSVCNQHKRSKFWTDFIIVLHWSFWRMESTRTNETNGYRLQTMTATTLQLLSGTKKILTLGELVVTMATHGCRNSYVNSTPFVVFFEKTFAKSKLFAWLW